MINPLTIHKGLRMAGVLGINERNLQGVLKNNPRRLYPRVDDKITTKRLAIEAGVRVPEEYAILEFPGHFQRLRDVADRHRSFVAKPARGSGGGGILVIGGVGKSGLRKTSGQLVGWDDVRYHVNNCLGGMYSFGGGSDRVLVEQRLRPHSAFAAISFRGVPDLRIIVYRGVPLMAMLRLPTSASDGKANLHVGGVGAGVDMASGCTSSAICHGRLIELHPDFETPVAGFEVPDWSGALEIAAALGEALGLGYVGVDLVIDEEHGPTMLEVNARPGIAIQVANRAGLKPRLAFVDSLDRIPTEPAARAQLAMASFGDANAGSHG